MTSVLHQEESLPAWHDAYPETGKVRIEGDVVLGRRLEGFDRPLRDLDLRHTSPVRAMFRPSGFEPGYVSWKRRGSGTTKVVA
jgi:hypothetical protein